MLEVATALFEQKKDVAAIQSIPLSATSNTRKIEILAADISTQLELLQKALCYATALDESYVNVDDENVYFLEIF